jgi:hypothetical protein
MQKYEIKKNECGLGRCIWGMKSLISRVLFHESVEGDLFGLERLQVQDDEGAGDRELRQTDHLDGLSVLFEPPKILQLSLVIKRFLYWHNQWYRTFGQTPPGSRQK